MLIFKPGMLIDGNGWEMFFPKHNFLNTNYYKFKIFCQWGFYSLKKSTNVLAFTILSQYYSFNTSTLPFPAYLLYISNVLCKLKSQGGNCQVLVVVLLVFVCSE